MGEAKIKAAQRAAAGGPMPTPEEFKAMEALSARFAEALWREGMALAGPSPHFMARMLAFVTAGRVIAEAGKQLHERPEATQEAAALGMRQAVIIAQRQAFVEEGRRLAAAGERRQ